MVFVLLVADPDFHTPHTLYKLRRDPMARKHLRTINAPKNRPEMRKSPSLSCGYGNFSYPALPPLPTVEHPAVVPQPVKRRKVA